MYEIIENTLEKMSGNLEVKNRDGEHLLTRLTYIGKNSEKNTGMYLARTFETSRRNNEKNDITSALVINDNYFIKSVEGSRPAINELLSRVINERPHLLLQVIDFDEIEVRSWDSFLIKYLTISAQDEDYALKSFSAGSDFNPYLMKKAQITSFLEAIFEEKESQVDSDV